MNGPAQQSGDVQVAADVLAWSPQRGPITSPAELAAAAREEAVVLCADADRVVRAADVLAPVSAVVRVDDQVAALSRQVMDLATEVSALRLRMLDIVESAATVLSDA